jgi:hypothetical protein
LWAGSRTRRHPHEPCGALGADAAAQGCTCSDQLRGAPITRNASARQHHRVVISVIPRSITIEQCS